MTFVPVLFLLLYGARTPLGMRQSGLFDAVDSMHQNLKARCKFDKNQGSGSLAGLMDWNGYLGVMLPGLTVKKLSVEHSLDYSLFLAVYT